MSGGAPSTSPPPPHSAPPISEGAPLFEQRGDQGEQTDREGSIQREGSLVHSLNQWIILGVCIKQQSKSPLLGLGGASEKYKIHLSIRTCHFCITFDFEDESYICYAFWVPYEVYIKDFSKFHHFTPVLSS